MRAPNLPTLLSALTLLVLLAGPGSAATFEVDSLEDSGAGTLRRAITEANDATGPDEIVFTPSLEGVITLTGPLPVVDDDLTVSGPGAGTLTVDADGTGRILEVRKGDDAPSLTVSGLTLTGGRVTDEDGGAILVRRGGDLVLDSMVVAGNRARSGGGVALTILGTGLPDIEPATLEARLSLFADNVATAFGGAIRSNDRGNRVVLEDTAVRDNRAGSRGGGIISTGNLKIEGSTIADNESEFGGGLELHLSGSPVIEVRNTTISGNSAGGLEISTPSSFESPSVSLDNLTIFGNGTAGLHSRELDLTVANTVIAGNGSADCFGDAAALTHAGSHNLDSDGSCGFTDSGDQSGTDPLLLPLGDYGGPTEAHAPLPNSPLIDAGDPTTCEATDQRGIGRPRDGDGDGDAVCDIGAFERRADEVVCSTDDTSHCLTSDRFLVTMSWTDPKDGITRPARTVPFSAKSGIFYFVDPENAEVLIKVLNGCPVNGHFWVFGAAATDVAYEISVIDTEAGVTRTYVNEDGSASPAINDTAAFETCP